MSLLSEWPFYSFILTVAHQISFFIAAIIYRFDKVTDLAGTSNFLILAVVGLLLGGSLFERQRVLTLLVTVWAIRLGSFLFMRVLVRRKDSRFDRMRDSILKWTGFWTLQILWVYVTSLPVTFVNMYNIADVPVDAIDHIGWSIWLLGFLFESMADYQRHRFNQRTRESSGKPFLDTGVWRYSRHPNYFGEILCWTGIWISAANGLFPAHPRQALLAISSPIITFVLLVFVSGIPLAEARDDRRNHRLMAYKQYKFATSPLLPMPRSWYAALPVGVKRWIFLDRYQLAFITPNLSRSSDSQPVKRGRSTTRKPRLA
jgi:steroid 5-alpha reductase family enzyme